MKILICQQNLIGNTSFLKLPLALISIPFLRKSISFFQSFGLFLLHLSRLFPRMLILFIYLSAVIILNFAVELKAVSTSVGLVVDAPSSNQVVPLNLSPDSFI